MKRVLIASMAAATLAGCGGRRPAPASVPAPAASPVTTGATTAPADWRRMATLADRDRLRKWRSTWLDALSRARVSGAGAAISAQGALLLPDVRLADPIPPPGSYRCRMFKLGGKAVGMRDFTGYPPFTCRIEREGSLLRFEKINGSQRPVGRIFPDPAGRPVFLGTLMLADETRPIAYGRDNSRDMAGFVDRVGDRRWRLVLPLPAFESLLDVIELVPASS
ncbi:DUF4893 domain-containing protein [Sphingomonas sp. IC4-52]|uniref:DUF4893 domain-containing protein n=1 Tax=Sphingomonas sp. IC4-52 TaxID=2887202 RepID=UPI001D120E3E|nr:DUF4893 domain-containing protein [Sphingomonas sp. IC4-52]MCC2979891.1 DUF4893 domain-containing protein [Sphingomonas sp. IC4-52]